MIETTFRLFFKFHFMIYMSSFYTIFYIFLCYIKKYRYENFYREYNK